MRYTQLLASADSSGVQELQAALRAATPVRLRPYQEAAQQAVAAAWEAQAGAVLAVMATGTGKTHTFLGTLAEEFRAGRASRALIVAGHRHLVMQPLARIVGNWQTLPAPAGIMGGFKARYDARLTVATVQSLMAREGWRLERLLAQGAISHLVIDECHFAAAPSYRALIARLREAHPGLRVLGVTATPTDELASVFDVQAIDINIFDAIGMGALAPYVPLGIQLPVSLADVRETKSGWNEGELADVMSAANALDVVTRNWQRLAWHDGARRERLQAPGEAIPAAWLTEAERSGWQTHRPTIAFTASVTQAHALAEAFNAAGVPAASVDASTSAAERQAQVDAYRRGALRVLVNCFVYVFGFDAPETACVLNAKPTRSDVVYTQMIGRGLRLAEEVGKQDCLILDFVPDDSRDMVLSVDLERRVRAKQRAASNPELEEWASVAEQLGLHDLLDAHGQIIDPDSVVVRALPLFASPAMRKVAWQFDGTVATVAGGERDTLVLVAPQHERMQQAEQLRAAGRWEPAWDAVWELVSQWHVYHVRGSQVTRLASGETREDVEPAALTWLDTHAEGWASERGKRWRRKQPSSKQAAFARRLGVWQEGMRAGELAQAITHKLTRSSLKRAGVLR